MTASQWSGHSCLLQNFVPQEQCETFFIPLSRVATKGRSEHACNLPRDYKVFQNGISGDSIGILFSRLASVAGISSSTSITFEPEIPNNADLHLSLKGCRSVKTRYLTRQVQNDKSSEFGLIGHSAPEYDGIKNVAEFLEVVNPSKAESKPIDLGMVGWYMCISHFFLLSFFFTYIPTDPLRAIFGELRIKSPTKRLWSRR